jgi:peptidyl-tRNA hydrolase
MTTTPFRERRFTPDEVRGILRRAVALAEGDADKGAAERALTQDEIEQLGGELGLPAAAIRQAIQGDGAPGTATPAPQGPGRRVVLEEEISGELPPSAQEDLVEVIQAVMADAGRAQVVGRTLTWTPTPAQGQERQLAVSVRARDGTTRVRVEESFRRLFFGLHLGLGLGFGLGVGSGLVVPTALAMQSVTVALGLGALCVVASFLAAHFIYKAVAARRMRQIGELRAKLCRVVREGAERAPERPVRARISAGTTGEASEEAEAEAEAEAGEGQAVRRAR